MSENRYLQGITKIFNKKNPISIMKNFRVLTQNPKSYIYNFKPILNLFLSFLSVLPLNLNGGIENEMPKMPFKES